MMSARHCFYHNLLVCLTSLLRLQFLTESRCAELWLTYMHPKIVFLPSAFLPMQDKYSVPLCMSMYIFRVGPAQQL